MKARMRMVDYGFNSHFKFRLCVMLALVGSLMSGCSKSAGKNQLPTIAIRGIVKIDGVPSRRAMLQLTPVQANGGLPGASGQVSDDGKFTLQTYAPGDGVPKGAYSVTLGPDFAKFMPVPPVNSLTIEIKDANSNLELSFQSTGKGGAGLPPPGMEKSNPANASQK